MHCLIYSLQEFYEVGSIIIFLSQMELKKCRKFAQRIQLVCKEARIQTND